MVGREEGGGKSEKAEEEEQEELVGQEMEQVQMKPWAWSKDNER